jgi:vanillate O-demethylase ferredoxin subunit
MVHDMIDMLVTRTRFEAERIHSFELRSASGEPLHEFSAGSHIDLHLPNGITRSYSLVNSPRERHRYVIAVSHHTASEGGSHYLFEHALVGRTISVSEPRNNFPLHEDAGCSVLIAGGIGITPIYCMLQRLQDIRASWQLHYGARNRASCAFLQQLMQLANENPGRIRFHFDEEEGRTLDLPGIVGNAPAGAHIYCCGPTAMLESFKTAGAALPPDHLHLEYFQPAAPVLPSDGKEFSVTVASTGQTFVIPEETSILEVLTSHGVHLDSGCQAGACGTCCVGVLSGIPDHHDYVLSAEEREANNKMMICVSRSKSDTLVLDI